MPKGRKNRAHSVARRVAHRILVSPPVGPVTLEEIASLTAGLSKRRYVPPDRLLGLLTEWGVVDGRGVPPSASATAPCLVCARPIALWAARSGRGWLGDGPSVVCTACCRREGLQAGAPLVEVCVRVLGRRCAEDAAGLEARWSREAVLPESCWSEVNDQAVFARKRRMDDEAERAAARRRQEERLARDIAAACEAAGAGWELDDLVRLGHGAFAVKVGIYPWGKTILEGSRAEIMRAVRDIVAEIRSARRTLKCPACGGAVPDEALVADWRCRCGARFVVSLHPLLIEPSPADRGDLWLAVRALPGVPTDLPNEVFAGVSLQDIVNGAWSLEPLNQPLHVFGRFARWRPFAEWPPTVQLCAALASLGFAPVVWEESRHHRGEAWSQWHVLWEGDAGGWPIAVGMEDLERGERAWVGLRCPILEMAERFGPEQARDADERLSEAFTEFLVAEPVVFNDCEVYDYISCGDAVYQGAYMNRMPDGKTLAAAAKSLESLLEDAVAACRLAVQRFLAHERPT